MSKKKKKKVSPKCRKAAIPNEKAKKRRKCNTKINKCKKKV